MTTIVLVRQILLYKYLHLLFHTTHSKEENIYRKLLDYAHKIEKNSVRIDTLDIIESITNLIICKANRQYEIKMK